MYTSLAEPSGCATTLGMGWELLLGHNCCVSEAQATCPVSLGERWI